MSRVLKYEIVPATGRISCSLPAGAEILCVQAQYDRPTLWASVDEARPDSERTIVAVGTGGEVPRGARYIGSVQLGGGTFVLHYFEI